MITETLDTIYPDLFAHEQSLQTDNLDDARRALRKVFRYDRPEIPL